MRLSTVVLFLFGVAVGGGAVYFVKTREGTPPQMGPAFMALPPPTAAALGHIEPFDGVISIGIALPDQLAGLKVEEGQHVKKGAVLAELKSRADRKMDVDLLDMQIKEATQKLHEIDESGDLQLKLEQLQFKAIQAEGPFDIKMQKLKVDPLKKQVAQAREGLGRIAPLSSISKQEKDQQELTVLQSQAELAGAVDLLEKLTVSHDLNLSLAKAKMELTKANRDRARKEVPLISLTQQRAMAAYRLDQTDIQAPSQGTILKILARPGELVGPPQPILQLADLTKMAVLAEVYETDIHKIFEGQKVVITSKVAAARDLTGRVVAIGKMIGKNRVYDADPLADVDRRVIEVKIQLDRPEAAAGLINLQVNVDFQPRN